MKRSILSTIFAVFVCLGLYAQADIVIFPESAEGPVKLMNAVNNGPIIAGADQKRDNFAAYRAAHIPYARTHDSNYCSNYGAPHTVDITAVFPDFSANVNKESSYDFTLTDRYLESIRSAGTEVFYRLGQSIEHAAKKYGIYPPESSRKWAQICEHIIRHYNEGWADGYEWNIRYWEIWNEPDLDSEEARRTNPRTWAGTDEEFFDLYETTAKHLKKCFPDLKIGGPASCGNEKWSAAFIAEMARRRVPMDFFSWHIYHSKPGKVASIAERFRRMLDDNGYTTTESILNEWNYVKGWTDQYVYSIRQMNSLKGAAFTAATMAALQYAPLDMAMYYDFRPSVFAGPFDMYTYSVQKPYYAFYAWNKLLKGKECVDVRVNERTGDLYCVASKGEDGHLRIFVVRYNEDNNEISARNVVLHVDGAWLDSDGEYFGHITDLTHMYTEIPLELNGEGDIVLSLDPNSFVLIEL